MEGQGEFVAVLEGHPDSGNRLAYHHSHVALLDGLPRESVYVVCV